MVSIIFQLFVLLTDEGDSGNTSQSVYEERSTLLFFLIFLEIILYFFSFFYRPCSIETFVIDEIK